MRSINILSKTGIVGIIFIINLLACQRVDYELAEQELLLQYIKDNNITTEPIESGFYYIETLEGTGEKLNLNYFVEVKYENRFLDGTVISSETIILPSGNCLGLILGVHHMRVGGKATLIIQSHLAFGKYGNGVVPGYTSLIYEVEVIKKINPRQAQ